MQLGIAAQPGAEEQGATRAAQRAADPAAQLAAEKRSTWIAHAPQAMAEENDTHLAAHLDARLGAQVNAQLAYLREERAAQPAYRPAKLASQLAAAPRVPAAQRAP
jgi:hypothetical protein